MKSNMDNWTRKNPGALSDQGQPNKDILPVTRYAEDRTTRLELGKPFPYLAPPRPPSSADSTTSFDTLKLTKSRLGNLAIKFGITSKYEKTKQSYNQYFNARDSGGRIVSFEDALQHSDQPNLDNLLYNFRQHRGFHMFTIQTTEIIVEYLYDLSLLIGSLKNINKFSDDFIKDELRVDMSNLLAYFDSALYDISKPTYNIRHPKYQESLQLGYRKTYKTIVNVILTIEIVKKLLPNKDIFDEIENSIKIHMLENIESQDILTVENKNSLMSIFTIFKTNLLDINKEGFKEGFGPFAPSVSKDKEHGDFTTIQNYFQDINLKEYLDSFHQKKLEDLFSFLVSAK